MVLENHIALIVNVLLVGVESDIYIEIFTECQKVLKFWWNSCPRLRQFSLTYCFQDFDLIKIQKIIKCEIITRGA